MFYWGYSQSVGRRFTLLTQHVTNVHEPGNWPKEIPHSTMSAVKHFLDKNDILQEEDSFHQPIGFKFKK